MLTESANYTVILYHLKKDKLFINIVLEKIINNKFCSCLNLIEYQSFILDT